MTAVIHGITLFAAGPHTHQKRWVGGAYMTWCSATEGPCQGHGSVAVVPEAPPKPPAIRLPDGRPCRQGHTDTYYRFQPSDGRWHMRCRPCNRRKNAEQRAA